MMERKNEADALIALGDNFLLHSEINFIIFRDNFFLKTSKVKTILKRDLVIDMDINAHLDNSFKRKKNKN